MSWELTGVDLPDLALGATLLGTGGGGDPHVGRLMVARALGGGSVTILDPDELVADQLVIPTGRMGASTVGTEKLPAGTEAMLAFRALERHLGRRATAAMPMECGGANSLMPLLVAIQAGLPVVDADGMGRAFPELSMVTFSVYGVQGSPIALAGERGDTVILDTGADDRQLEWLARGLTIRMGGMAHIAQFSMTGAQVRRTAVPRTLSMALALGRAIRQARSENRSPFEAIQQALAPTLYNTVVDLFSGTVTDVDRRTTSGFGKGTATITATDRQSELVLHFQNEFLVAIRDGERVAVVPDLICVTEQDTATPIITPNLRYGQRVRVLAISTPAMMRTDAALNAFGPGAFGLDEVFVPVEQLARR